MKDIKTKKSIQANNQATSKMKIVMKVTSIILINLNLKLNPINLQQLNKMIKRKIMNILRLLNQKLIKNQIHLIKKD